MKQRIDFEPGEPGAGANSGLRRGFYIRDYDFPHPVGPFASIAEAHNWLVKARPVVLHCTRCNRVLSDDGNCPQCGPVSVPGWPGRV